MTEYQYLETRREGPALVVTMVNPPRQLMNATMVRELSSLAGEIRDDPDVRVLILTGGADGVFITHYDVGELTVVSDRAREAPSVSTGADLHDTHNLFLTLQNLPQPVIAAINGIAMGGGCELALACDFRIIATNGIIGLPEVRVGILPGAGGTQRMARLIGTAKALELMLLGNTIDGETAQRLGLVHRSVDADQVVPLAVVLATELAARPRLSLALIKQCVLKGTEMPLLDGLRFEQDAFWQTMRSDDAARLMRDYQQNDRRLDQQ